jgi:hypothetical protein
MIGDRFEVDNTPGWDSDVTEDSFSPIYFGPDSTDNVWIPGKIFPVPTSITSLFESGGSRMVVIYGKDSIIEGEWEIKGRTAGGSPLTILADEGQTARVIDPKAINASGTSRAWTLGPWFNPVIERKNYSSSGGILNLDLSDTSKFKVTLTENITKVNLYSATTPTPGQEVSVVFRQSAGNTYTLPHTSGNWEWINKENGINKDMAFGGENSGSSGFPPSGVSDNQRMFIEWEYDTAQKFLEIGRRSNIYDP